MPNNMKKAGIKYSKGGPKTSNYVGNPIGYFNDKAEYGKYMMQTAGETPKADKYIAKYGKKQDKRIAKKGWSEGVEMGKRREKKYNRARYDQAVAREDGAAKSQAKARRKAEKKK